MDVWPTHQPDRGWEQMDHQSVIEIILKRAGDPDWSAIEDDLGAIADELRRLKESAVSVLSSVLTKDGYLERKLSEIEALSSPSLTAIQDSMIPNRSIWTRDTLAMSQGFRLAPHQAMLSLPASGGAVGLNLDRLEKSTREAASHLQRTEASSRKAGLVGTNVFIGHGRSLLWRELKDFIEDRLGLPVDEFNSVPIAGVTTAARLSELLDAAAFAFLILTAEDEQPDGTLRARENVLQEAGLFQGRLGFGRAIILLEEGCEEFSNIHGSGQIRFPRGNISAKFEDIRSVLERKKLINS
jgi:predicted nucleotide-binding protein